LKRLTAKRILFGSSNGFRHLRSIREGGKPRCVHAREIAIHLRGKWSGTEVKTDGVEHLITKKSDIMGVLAEAEAKKKAA
jgi:hypothetical protein